MSGRNELHKNQFELKCYRVFEALTTVYCQTICILVVFVLQCIERFLFLYVHVLNFVIFEIKYTHNKQLKKTYSHSGF